MQKPLSELAFLPQHELDRIVQHEPLLVTRDGEPTFVAQSLSAFENMVRRLRHLEAAQHTAKCEKALHRPLAKVIQLRPR